MRFATVGDDRTAEAMPGGRGRCEGCGEEVVARCGDPQIRVWHWAHKPGSKCVHAISEPETEWHKGWKGIVPEQNREVVMRKGGKTRRADICTSTGTVIELQHSDITSEELISRERFYNGMFWIADSDGRTRVINEPRNGKWPKGVKHYGFKVHEVTFNDSLPVVGHGRRGALVDIGDYVCRVVPSSFTTSRSFLATIVSGCRVRDDVRATCGESPGLDGFLERIVADI